MKKIVIALLLIAIPIIYWSCEKDDICTEDTTPKMVVTFYDNDNPSVPKQFVKLQVVLDGNAYNNPNKLVFTNLDSIGIPLRPNAASTKYHLFLTYVVLNDTIITNDIVEFKYSKEDLFVSRACGYKSNFRLSPDPIVPTDSIGTPQNPWIKNITVINREIINETAAHVKILY